ncbi:MAG TPA: hypothetical protein VMY99_02605 [Nevskiaceae bacterium]|nr:hypothetical protein [Nevskiaceae bacterium]
MIAGHSSRAYKNIVYGVVGTVLLGASLGLSMSQRHASALELKPRSIEVGTTAAGTATTHAFSFTYASTSSIGSVVFQYCDSPLEVNACVAPTGLDASGAALQQQTGETGYSITAATTNQITLSRAAAATGTIASVYTFGNVVNPTGSPRAFYVRIFTYATTNGSGPYTDFGAVVSATTQGVTISTEVPPILNFCVGQTISGSDCSTADGDVVDLGTLASSDTATGTSQMMVGTNAGSGMNITLNGTTLTSGNNVITALSSPTASAPGTAQFGINLRANTNPPVGTNPSGAGVATPTSTYNIVNRFKFHVGDAIATTPSTTDTRKFTVSYMANVPASQDPGVYVATITYVCAANF